MIIDHVVITEFPKAIDSRTHRSLVDCFKRYADERRIVHLIILPNGQKLDSQSLTLIADLNHVMCKAGGVIGFVTRKAESKGLLDAVGADRHFRCFTSAEEGVAFLAPLGRRLNA